MIMFLLSPRMLNQVLFRSVILKGRDHRVYFKKNCASSSTCVEYSNDICRITLNNPKKRNALSLEMLCSLENSLKGLEKRTGVVVLKGSGTVLSSGHNLKELKLESGLEHHRKTFEKCSEVMMLIQRLPMPVVAQVSGLATAAGCQLVASCDMAVAAESAQFATPGVKVGLFCSTPAVAVARSVPGKVALHMLFSGKPITAREALLHGLVSKVVADADLDDSVAELAELICTHSRAVNAVGKECYYKQIGLPLEQAYKLASATMLANLQMDDCQEGIAAFEGKRKPNWKQE